MVKVNKEKCIGCNICVNMCPQGFEMQGSTARVIAPNASCIQEAADVCPVNAIELNEKNQPSNQGSQSGSSFIKPNQGAGTGRQAGRGQRQGPGTGSGPGGYCICPSCGHKVAHRRGAPCFEMKCPECGSVMTRQK